MQGQDLLDLVEGRDSWCNIPDSIRHAFKSFNDLMIRQGQYTHMLEGSLREMASRQDQFNLITSGTLDEMLVSFSNFSTFTHSKLSTFVDKDTFDKITSEITQNLAHVHTEVSTQKNIMATQLSTKVELSVFSQEIDRLDQAITKDYSVEEQRESQYSQLVSAMAQLDESCKSISSDMVLTHTLIEGKASKAQVATALKKRVSHEELDQAVHQMIEEVNGIVKRSMLDSEGKLAQITDKITSLESQTCNTVGENSAPIILLERQISKNFAEINKMVLDLDLKPDRTELQQLESSLENHFKLISGISQDLVDLRHTMQQTNDNAVELQHTLHQSMQHTEAAVEAQQSSVVKINKGLLELSRSLSSKADKGEVEQSMMPILVQLERQIKGVESKIANLRSHDHNSLESGAIVKGFTSQNFEELLKIIESKADREDVTRISKLVMDIDSSNHWHLEEEERRQAGMVRQVRSEVERHLRTEIDRCMRSEVELYFHTTIERKEAEWKEERQEELAVKANLTEVHQVRKETTELASRILSCSKELHDLHASIPRRLEAMLSRDTSKSCSVKEKSALQLHVALDQLHDELEQVKVKLKKKLERGDVQELLKTWQEINADPPSPSKGKTTKFSSSSISSPSDYVTKEELLHLLKQKVDFNELVNSLSLKMDKNDFHETAPNDDNNTKALPKDWLTQALSGKVDSKDFTELLELVHKKLDIAVFLLAKTEMTDNIRKLECNLCDLSHSLHLCHSTPNLSAHSPPPSPTKKQSTFLDTIITTNSNPTTSTHPPFSASLHSTSSHKPHQHHIASPSHHPPSTTTSHHHPSPPTHSHYLSVPTHSHSPSSGATPLGGKWFKDVKPTQRYLEILQELNKGLSPTSGVAP
eukprot:Phypoly_transcript_01506.p1 GENE.Phypoly_transcript_01506~~Phypoly_transcript_01506.p1  ORF type:complete len:876 (-),score=163.51 Phypoly_transcript_01506:100-2727(-)